MTVIAFPGARSPKDDSAERLRGIEKCLAALAGEADELGHDLLAHLIAVAREAARDSLRTDR